LKYPEDLKIYDLFSDLSKKKSYDGTLFRFPLRFEIKFFNMFISLCRSILFIKFFRTKKTASQSEIKKVESSVADISRFFNDLKVCGITNFSRDSLLFVFS
jgi:hypothetical protein